MLVAGNVATVTILEGMVTQRCFGGIVTIVFFQILNTTIFIIK